MHCQILHSRAVNFPSREKAARKAEFTLALLQDEPLQLQLSLCILTGKARNLFPVAVWKSHFPMPHRGEGDANDCILSCYSFAHLPLADAAGAG